MSHITYKVVQHDGGWAYTVNGVFSEPFASHAAALAAAKRAAAEQRVPGRTEAIEYETPTANGTPRPPPAPTVPKPTSRMRRSLTGRGTDGPPDCRRGDPHHAACVRGEPS